MRRKQFKGYFITRPENILMGITNEHVGECYLPLLMSIESSLAQYKSSFRVPHLLVVEECKQYPCRLSIAMGVCCSG